MKCWNPPWKRLQSQRQKKLDVKILAADHTTMQFGIQGLGIRLFSHDSQLNSGTITPYLHFKRANLWPEKFIYNAANIHVHVQCSSGKLFLAKNNYTYQCWNIKYNTLIWPYVTSMSQKQKRISHPRLSFCTPWRHSEQCKNNIETTSRTWLPAMFLPMVNMS